MNNKDFRVVKSSYDVYGTLYRVELLELNKDEEFGSVMSLSLSQEEFEAFRGEVGNVVTINVEPRAGFTLSLESTAAMSSVPPEDDIPF